jgi:hypothetical protein
MIPGLLFVISIDTKWTVTLFGNYVKPVSDFTGVWQEDLKAAYVKDSISIQKTSFFSWLSLG